MSHISQIKTVISNQDHLVQALKDLGYTVEMGGQVCDGFRHYSVEVRVVTGGRYDIGFVKNGNSYEAMADWSMLHENQRTFIGKLTQRYAANRTKASLTAKGFRVAKETKEGQVLRLVLRRIGA